MDPSSPTPPYAGKFLTNRWTLIFDIKEGQERVKERALDELCQHYWLPIYAFVRSKRTSREEAEDLTQSFFEKLIQGEILSQAHVARGKLRTYLLTCLENFMHSAYRKDSAQKRGGGHTTIPIDSAEAERLLASRDSQTLSPEKAFDRAWGITLINTIHETLASEYLARGKAQHFEVLSGFLAWNARQISYAEAAEELEITEAAIKQSVRRIRQRFATLLRRHLAYTTETEAEVDEELQSLFAAFR